VVNETIQISSGEAAAVIALRGAEPLSWSICGCDLLWRADPAYWERTSPILFPIGGRARNDTIRVDGRSHRIDVHGFAASKDFSVVEKTADTVRLTLGDDADTREIFPFPFHLEVHYRLEPACLSVCFRVLNCGDTTLPYAIGFHPGFRWPQDDRRPGYRVEFEQAEAPSVPVITADGLFSERRRPVPLHAGVLPLSDELLADGALCFLDARSRWLRLVADDGSAIMMTVEDLPHLAVWSRPGAPFICLEAWTGHGDPDGFEADIREKPSMRFLAPGTEARHRVRLICEDRALIGQDLL
jgi:galactose mutarotase-like enzyme